MTTTLKILPPKMIFLNPKLLCFAARFDSIVSFKYMATFVQQRKKTTWYQKSYKTFTLTHSVLLLVPSSNFVKGIHGHFFLVTVSVSGCIFPVLLLHSDLILVPEFCRGPIATFNGTCPIGRISLGYRVGYGYVYLLFFGKKLKCPCLFIILDDV